MKNSRRDFLKKMIASTAAISLVPVLHSCTVTGSLPIPQRMLGKTGRKVGIYSLGGQATLETPGKEELAIEIINRALDLGLNYIDTAAAYGRATETLEKKDAMGTSEKNSVVDSTHQVHSVPNLFVVDGSSFTTGAGVNPTSTIMALALRAADKIWDRRQEWN